MLLRTLTMTRRAESVNLILLPGIAPHPCSFQDPSTLHPCLCFQGHLPCTLHTAGSALHRAAQTQQCHLLQKPRCITGEKRAPRPQVNHKTLQSLASDRAPISSLISSQFALHQHWMVSLFLSLSFLESFLLEKSHLSFQIQLRHLITSMPGPPEGLVCNRITTLLAVL